MRRRASVIVAAALLAGGCGGEDGPPFEAIGDDGVHEHIAIGQGSVWLGEDNRVIGLDPVRREPSTPVRRLSGRDSALVTAVTAGPEGVFALVLADAGFSVVPIDARSGRPGRRRPVELSDPPDKRPWDRDLMAVGDRHVFAARRGARAVAGLDLSSGKRTLLRTRAAQDLAVGGGYVWIAESTNRAADGEPGPGAVVRSAPDGGGRRRIALDEAPSAVAWGAGSLWVLSKSRVTRLAPGGRPTATVPLGSRDATVGSIAASDDSVWVFTNPYEDGLLLRIDPRTNRLAGKEVEPPAAEPRDARQLAVDGKVAWLASEHTVLIRVPPD